MISETRTLDPDPERESLPRRPANAKRQRQEHDGAESVSSLAGRRRAANRSAPTRWHTLTLRNMDMGVCRRRCQCFSLSSLSPSNGRLTPPHSAHTLSTPRAIPHAPHIESSQRWRRFTGIERRRRVSRQPSRLWRGRARGTGSSLGLLHELHSPSLRHELNS